MIDYLYGNSFSLYEYGGALLTAGRLYINQADK
ncbi:hypothetical protein HCH_02539 [Hahella chejuensis KCTC 2396]|uniref:Uncharacterized protein n=1 Tax=Hahella chejuensis (strain KCTC 2396) TaxID=349521 RepID=Q2SJ34_HAHCH|nr:hypothetical protein HCH_02539 [Hahella chejuensis KCTC 2396]